MEHREVQVQLLMMQANHPKIICGKNVPIYEADLKNSAAIKRLSFLRSFSISPSPSNRNFVFSVLVNRICPCNISFLANGQRDCSCNWLVDHYVITCICFCIYNISMKVTTKTLESNNQHPHNEDD